MFGWLFGSHCPVDPQAKAWIEDRLLWLRDEFGADDLHGGIEILPTSGFFPDRYDGSEAAARLLFDRACEYMGVDADAVRLHFFRLNPDSVGMVNAMGEMVATGAAGTFQKADEPYQPGVIRLNVDELVDPSNVIGTLAHELAHQRLMGEDRVTGDEFDNELLTDLTVVFKGLGIFLANSPRAWVGDYTNWPGTKLRKPGYMTAPMFAYALALRAWARGDDRAEWQSHLRLTIRSEFRQAVRFLTKTGDTRVHRRGRK